MPSLCHRARRKDRKPTMLVSRLRCSHAAVMCQHCKPLVPAMNRHLAGSSHRRSTASDETASTVHPPRAWRAHTTRSAQSPTEFDSDRSRVDVAARCGVVAPTTRSTGPARQVPIVSSRRSFGANLWRSFFSGLRGSHLRRFSCVAGPNERSRHSSKEHRPAAVAK